MPSSIRVPWHDAIDVVVSVAHVATQARISPVPADLAASCKGHAGGERSTGETWLIVEGGEKEKEEVGRGRRRRKRRRRRRRRRRRVGGRGRERRRGRSTGVAALRAAVHDVGRLRRGYGAVGLSSGYGDVGLKGYGAIRL